jgi:predicted O-methyltransferase YrrM
MISPELEHYISAHTTPATPLLRELERRTYLTTLYPRMISGHVLGKFLEMISLMIRPDKILEIGTFTGYGAVSLARGLKAGGCLITIEQNAELIEPLTQLFQEAGLEQKIQVIHGNASEIIIGLKDTFDLVFLDADKENYSLYYEKIIDKIRPGGFLLADNVLWSLKVLDRSCADVETESIRKFNTIVATDDRVEQVLLPLRDGLMLVRKK